MRPLFYEFPEIGEEGYRLESQHMVGGVLMVAPVTKPGVASWDVHLPPSALWYEYTTGKKAQQRGDETRGLPYPYLSRFYVKSFHN